MRRVHITTFGCQMNKLDSEIVAEALVSTGHDLVRDEAAADVILINTCAIRDQAENRVMSRLGVLRERKKAEPNLLIGVMGCMAQRVGEGILTRFPHVDLVCGTKEFPNLPDLLEAATHGQVLAVERKIDLDAAGARMPHERRLHSGPSAFVSAMRGCNYACSYCIVPRTRGREVSRPVADIVREVQNLAARGAVEITLLGQTIDAYGKEFGASLAGLLRAVHAVEAIKRIRFITSHPCEIDIELMKTMHELPRVCEYLHMPAQSGNDRILGAMRRRYTRAIYEEKIEQIHKYAPGVEISSDFIVGFPSETEAEFEDTHTLIQQAEFVSSYVFKFSPRPGTIASKLDDEIPFVEKRRRNAILLECQEEIQRRRNAELVGQKMEVLIEGISPRDASRLMGRTTSNQIVVFPAPEDAALRVGTLVTVAIGKTTPLTLYGVAENFPAADPDASLYSEHETKIEPPAPHWELPVVS